MTAASKYPRYFLIWSSSGGEATQLQAAAGGVAAGQLDGVHGGHGQARAVDHAADVARELDEVADAGALGLHLQRVLLVDVTQLGDVGVAVEGVVVEVELGVGGQEASVGGEDERVDLRQGAVVLGEGVVEAGDEGGGGPHQVAAQADSEGQAAALEGLEADGGVHRRLVDALR